MRGSETATLVLRGTFPSGATIEKRLTFTAGSYPIDLEVRTSGFPDQLSRIGVGWRHQIGEAIQGDPELRYRGTLVLEDKKVVTRSRDESCGLSPKVFAAPVGWVGYADHYFAAALIPAEPGASAGSGESRSRRRAVAVDEPARLDGRRVGTFHGVRGPERRRGSCRGGSSTGARRRLPDGSRFSPFPCSGC